MTPFEITKSLDSMVVLADTREQDTYRFRLRMEAMGCPFERAKLDFGDYSAKCTLPNGAIFDLSSLVAIERKMHLDELCQCYTKGRERFTKEFERAAGAGGKIYLLVEDGSWEKAYKGVYRSQFNPKAMIASMTAWMARYNCPLLFCTSETSGQLIHEILYRELKERLEHFEGEVAR